MQLAGVVTSRSKAQDIALISVNGRPAQPYRVGSIVTGAWVLAAVDRDGVKLSGASGASGVLELMRPAAAAPAPERPTPMLARPQRAVTPEMVEHARRETELPASD